MLVDKLKVFFKFLFFSEEIKMTSKMEIDEWGNKFWKNAAGEFHREDGPAHERVDGTKEWWINGNLHREDGPAREWSNGIKWWLINGKLHREDGPAIEGADGTKWWCINGKRMTKEEFEEWQFENLQARARNIKAAGRR